MSAAILSTREGDKTISMIDAHGVDYGDVFVDSFPMRRQFEIFKIAGHLEVSKYNFVRLDGYCARVERLWASVQSLPQESKALWIEHMETALEVSGENIFPAILGYRAALLIGERLLPHV